MLIFLNLGESLSNEPCTKNVEVDFGICFCDYIQGVCDLHCTCDPDCKKTDQMALEYFNDEYSLYALIILFIIYM